MKNKPHTNVERLLSVVAIQREIATVKLELGTVMDLVAERVQPLTGADGAAVELVEDSELVYRAASGTLSAHLGMRLEVDASISGLCVRTGEILRSDDTEDDERVDREACRKIGARSMIVVPLHHDRQTVGVLKVSAVEPGAFGEEEVYTLQLMTALIAAGMSHTAQFEAEQALLDERTQALESIQRSEEHLRAIFEQSAVGIAETDLDGNFVLLNQRYCEITGYSREELLDRRMQDITHHEDLTESLRLLRRLAEKGEEYAIEKRYVRKDGSAVWVHNAVSPRWDGSDSPAYAVAVVQDITRRKLREANADFLAEIQDDLSRLSSAREILQTVGEKLGVHLGLTNCLCVDVDEARDEGAVENIWSAGDTPLAPETINLSDYVSEGFYHTSRAGETLVIRDTETDSRTNARACRTVDIRSFVTVPFHRDGEWRYLLVVCDSRPRDWRDGEIELVRELSNRLFPRIGRARAEEALRESQERLFIATEAAQMGTWELDLVRDHSPRRSLRHDQIFGYEEPQSEWGERIAKRHVLEEDREIFDAAFARARQTGELEFEVRVRWPDGGVHWMGAWGRFCFAENGEPVRGAGVNFDITERKRAEEELRNTLREARQYASQLQKLREAGLIIGSELSLNEVLHATTEQAREIVGAHQSVTSLTVDEDRSQAITSVSLSDKYADWRDYDERPNGSSIHSEVCRTNRPMRVTRKDLGAHPAFEGFGEASESHPPLRDWLAAPLIGRNGENTGLIQLSDRYEGEFTETDEAILVQLAQLASVALENVRLYTQSREAERRYRDLVEGLDAIVWEAKAPGLALSYVSHRAEYILGYPLWRWLAEPGFLFDLIHPEDREYAEAFYEAAASCSGTREAVEYRVSSAGGREIWLRDKVRAIRDENGDPARLTGLLVDVTEIKRAEEALLEIREAERRRIARDLHDSVLQDISGALQSIQALQAERQSGVEVTEEGLDQSLVALRQAVGGLREAVYDLRRDDEKPLINEVEALIELNRQMVPECDLTLHVESGFPEEISAEVNRELLRIVHEGLVNIRRHSGARRANVTLGAGGNEVWAGIFDDGGGFDQARTPEGMGLSGMRERAGAMGGKLELRSEPNRGTSVTVTIPLSWS